MSGQKRASQRVPELEQCVCVLRYRRTSYQPAAYSNRQHPVYKFLCVAVSDEIYIQVSAAIAFTVVMWDRIV